MSQSCHPGRSINLRRAVTMVQFGAATLRDSPDFADSMIQFVRQLLQQPFWNYLISSLSFSAIFNFRRRQTA